MKRIISSFIVCIIVCMIGQTAIAQTFSIQGVLRDPLGRTVEDGAYGLTFRIYSAETGGTALWTETLGSVDVKHGVFSVELGKTTSMANLTFSTQYYIGISVEGGQELEPRIKMTNSPSSYGVFGVKNTFPSSGNVGVGVASPAAGLHIKTQNTADNLLKIESSAAGGGAMTVDASGKIGLNVIPEQALDIDGNLKMRNGSILFSDGSSLSSAYFGGSASSLTNNGNVIITTDADDNGSGSVQVVSGAATVMTVANDGNISTTGSISSSGNISTVGTLAAGSISSSGNVSSAGTLAAAGIKLPFAFEPNTEYVGSPGNYISFGHTGFSEDFIGYKANTFYFKDSQAGIDATEPDVVVGGRVKDKTGFLAPVGSITIFAGSTPPEGWLICDGSLVSLATYPDLYSVIGTTYGGYSIYFNLPNLKGKVPVGRDAWDASFDVLNKQGGAKTHTLTTDEIPAHSHVVDPPATYTNRTGAHSHTISVNMYGNPDGWSDYGRNYWSNTWASNDPSTSTNGDHEHYVDIGGFWANNTGGGAAHNNLQPYIVLNYIIKY
ncbi:MAG: phage tail protein [Candidatus Zhuqueibacterota bacterium]